MKYYSELLKEIFDTVEELNAAEMEKMNETAERDAALEKILVLAEERDEITAEYNKLKDEFIKTYGSFVIMKGKDGKYHEHKSKSKVENDINFPFFTFFS